MTVFGAEVTAVNTLVAGIVQLSICQRGRTLHHRFQAMYLLASSSVPVTRLLTITLHRFRS